MKATELLPRFVDRSMMPVMDPALISLLGEFLGLHRAVRWNKDWVITSWMPPYPGAACERFMNALLTPGTGAEGPASVTVVLPRDAEAAVRRSLVRAVARLFRRCHARGPWVLSEPG